MNYIFLIVVMVSGSSNQQIIPMDTIEQCNAALKAMEIVHEKRSGWRGDPKVDNANCIEVKK